MHRASFEAGTAARVAGCARRITQAVVRLLLCSLLACTGLCAQAADLDYQPQWKVHDRAAYELTRCRKSNSKTKPLDHCVTQQLEIEVLRVDARGSVQRWKSDLTLEIISSGVLTTTTADAIAEGSMFALDIEFDETGVPLRLVNAKETRALLQKIIRGAAFGTDRQRPQLDALGQELMARLSGSDEQLLALATRDASILYSPMGGRFPIGETTETEASTATPFSTTPLRSRMRITAKALEGREFDLQVVEDIDREAASKAMEEAIGPSLQPLGREATDYMRRQLATLVWRRESSYVLQPDSGWPRHAFWKMTAEWGDSRKLESMEFKRVR